MSLKPLDPADLEHLEAELAHTRKLLGFIPNSLLIMGRRPGLIRAFAGLAGEVFRGADLEPELKDMVAHVASTAAGCVYCQAHTAAKLASGGTADEKVERAWEFESSDLFSPAEVAALRLARDAGGVPNAVTKSHFDDLGQYFSDVQIVDIVAIVSLFGFLNRWNDTFATPLEDMPAGYASDVLSRRGWAIGKHTG